MFELQTSKKHIFLLQSSCHVFFWVILAPDILTKKALWIVDTNSGKIAEANVKGWSPRSSGQSHIVEYATEFTVPSDFGSPGAILITNCHSKEFYLVEVLLQVFKGGTVFFPANTWVHSRNDNPESRIIFRNYVGVIC